MYLAVHTSIRVRVHSSASTSASRGEKGVCYRRVQEIGNGQEQIGNGQETRRASQNFVNNLGGAGPDAGRAGDGRIEERLKKGAQSRPKRL
eukprot:scaffold108546_cov59-Attheya_sp.AAC.1